MRPPYIRCVLPGAFGATQAAPRQGTSVKACKVTDDAASFRLSAAFFNFRLDHGCARRDSDGRRGSGWLGAQPRIGRPNVLYAVACHSLRNDGAKRDRPGRYRRPQPHTRVSGALCIAIRVLDVARGRNLVRCRRYVRSVVAHALWDRNRYQRADQPIAYLARARRRAGILWTAAIDCGALRPAKCRLENNRAGNS